MWRSITSQSLQALDDIREKEAAELLAKKEANAGGEKHTTHQKRASSEVRYSNCGSSKKQGPNLSLSSLNCVVFVAEREEDAKEESVEEEEEEKEEESWRGEEPRNHDHHTTRFCLFFVHHTTHLSRPARWKRYTTTAVTRGRERGRRGGRWRLRRHHTHLHLLRG